MDQWRCGGQLGDRPDWAGTIRLLKGGEIIQVRGAETALPGAVKQGVEDTGEPDTRDLQKEAVTFKCRGWEGKERQ